MRRFGTEPVSPRECLQGQLRGVFARSAPLLGKLSTVPPFKDRAPVDDFGWVVAICAGWPTTFLLRRPVFHTPAVYTIKDGRSFGGGSSQGVLQGSSGRIRLSPTGWVSVLVGRMIFRPSVPSSPRARSPLGGLRLGLFLLRLAAVCSLTRDQMTCFNVVVVGERKAFQWLDPERFKDSAASAGVGHYPFGASHLLQPL